MSTTRKRIRGSGKCLTCFAVLNDNRSKRCRPCASSFMLSKNGHIKGSFKKCLICSSPISSASAHEKKIKYFCSRECAGENQATSFLGEKNPHWRGGNIKKRCKNCGQEFEASPGREKVSSFCSRKCTAVFSAGLTRGTVRCILCKLRFDKKDSIRKYKKYFHPECFKQIPTLVRVNIKKDRQKIKVKIVVPEKIKKLFELKSRAKKPHYCKVCKKDGVLPGRVTHKECRRSSLIDYVCYNCGVIFKRRYRATKGGALYCNRKCFKRVGDQNPRWKGGVTSINQKIRASEEYKTWRKDVFKRDKFTCVWCGQVGGVLHADHIKPFSLYPEFRTTLSNGRTLCLACHKKTDSYLTKAKKLVRI